jgi:hypothetical protein
MLIFNQMFMLVGNLLMALGLLTKHPAFVAVAALMYSIVRILDAMEKQKAGTFMETGELKPLWETDPDLVEDEGYVGLDGTRYDAAGNVLPPRREFVDMPSRHSQVIHGGGHRHKVTGPTWRERFEEELIRSRYTKVSPTAGTERGDIYEEKMRQKRMEEALLLLHSIQNPDFWKLREMTGDEIPIFHKGGEYKAPSGQREGLAMLADGERVSRPGESLLPDRITIDVNVNVTGGTLSEAELTRTVSAGFMELIRRGDRRLPNRAAMTGVTW